MLRMTMYLVMTLDFKGKTIKHKLPSQKTIHEPPHISKQKFKKAIEILRRD